MRYAGDGELMLQGFVDSDWAGDTSDKKSTLICCFSLALGVIFWFNGTIALSSCKFFSLGDCSSNVLSINNSKHNLFNSRKLNF
jgi:hypothetical protein